MLFNTEISYRDSLHRHREWIIKQKAEAELELKRRKEKAEGEARERDEKLAREGVERLLAQAQVLDHANKIRGYVESVLLRATECR